VIERASLRLAALVTEPEVKILKGIGAEAVALACKHFHLQTRDVRKLMKHYEKRSAAREECIGPLQKCYTLLFGARPKRGNKSKNGGSSVADHGPFVRFAVAFFKEMKCPCTSNTVKAVVRDWRKNSASRVGGKTS
jgi:hypothetical protein